MTRTEVVNAFILRYLATEGGNVYRETRCPTIKVDDGHKKSEKSPLIPCTV